MRGIFYCHVLSLDEVVGAEGHSAVVTQQGEGRHDPLPAESPQFFEQIGR